MMALRLHIKRELGADGINTSLLKQERQSGWENSKGNPRKKNRIFNSSFSVHQ
jgi:hypothetical protein